MSSYNELLIKPPQTPRKFYFLEYFYVLLKSVNTASNQEKVFDQFITLKDMYQLGESRYKKLTVDTKNSRRLGRYKYTFLQVVSEAELYNLISISGVSLVLTSIGEKALEKYEVEGQISFNRYLFSLMEKKYHAFRYLIELCYKSNPAKGLLVFPTYSAYQLGIERATIRTSGDLKDYFNTLRLRLEQDIERFTGKRIPLIHANGDLINSLVHADLISDDNGEAFNEIKYNVILKRVRDYWLRFFLQLYEFEISLNNFDLWAYRAKQIGLLHITQFYPDPNLNGRVVYPLSVTKEQVSSGNFTEIHKYDDGKKLYLHNPFWNRPENQDTFLETLHSAYREARRISRTYFVGLPGVRERVCYNMRIPEFVFDDFLGKAFKMQEQLKIRISLEVDKLPEETNLTYLQREPVMIDGKLRNIIAIDLA